VWAIDLDPAASLDLLNAMGKPRSKILPKVNPGERFMGKDLGYTFEDFTPLDEDIDFL
jgi:hypothetical protein